MAKAKNTNGDSERKDEIDRQLSEEIAAARAALPTINARIRAEQEALYAANVPPPGDPRIDALALAAELRNAIDACIHSLKANEDVPRAIARLRRMERALHYVRRADELAPQEIVRALSDARAFYLSSEGSDLARESACRMLHAIGDVYRRRGRTWSKLADLSDDQIVRVLEARNGDEATSQLLEELRIRTGAKNVSRIKKKKL